MTNNPKILVKKISENSWEFLNYQGDKTCWNSMMVINYRKDHKDYEVEMIFLFTNELGIDERIRQYILAKKAIKIIKKLKNE